MRSTYNSDMKFIVDADSFPVRARELLFRRALKEGISVVCIARNKLRLPDHVAFVLAGDTPGAADAWIVENASSDDMIFTRDIPLAEVLVSLDRAVLNDRGTVFVKESVAERRSLRDVMAGMRTAGLVEMAGGGYGDREYKAFADALDRELVKRRSSHAP